MNFKYRIKISNDKSISTEERNQKKVKRRILKNIFLVSIGFMLLFTASASLESLESSINAKEGLGVTSLAATYTSFTLFNLFLPPIVINWLGTKWVMVVAIIMYMASTAAHLHPAMYTFIPTALLTGAGASLLWCAKCFYIVIASEASSAVTKESADVVLSQFFGLFFMIFPQSQVWGNLISSLVLNSGNNTAAVSSLNESSIADLCGASFLPQENSVDALPSQPQEKINLLVAIYLAFQAGAALLIAFGVDSMKRADADGTKNVEVPSSSDLLLSTVRTMVEPNQLLLATTMCFIGFQESFFIADFTTAFVSCAIGTGTVGFVMMTYGVVGGVAGVVIGYAVKITGRPALICLGAVLNTALFITVLTWKPHPNNKYVLFIIAGGWGIGTCIWMVQINSYYGTLFPGREQAAYAVSRLWNSFGCIVAYVIHPYMKVNDKSRLLFALMISGLAGYMTVEYRERKRKKNGNDPSVKVETEDEIVSGCIH